MAANTPTPERVDLPNLQAVWETYSGTVVGWALNVLAAAAILIGGIWIAGKIRALIRHRIENGKRLDRTLGSVFANLIYYTLIAFVLIAVLNRFGVETTSLVAVLGAASLAIGLALQGTLTNVAAGVLLVLFRPYRIGDYIDVAGLSGTVKEIALFSTELFTLDRVKVVVPNALCLAQPIRNYTQDPVRRCDIIFNIAYDADIDRALEVISRVVRADPRFLDAPDKPWIQMTGVGPSSIELQLRAWVDNDDYWDARFATIRSVKDGFDKAGIGFPLPQQVLLQPRVDQPRLSGSEAAAAPTRGVTRSRSKERAD